MIFYRIFLFCAVMLFSVPLFSQKMTREQYIEKYKDIAVKQMGKHKIPASIILAQGCLESGDGNSTLAVKANNHFGIKCHDTWIGRKFRHDDDEKNECFRRYDNPYDSYTDHSHFLTSRSRYASLFDLPVTDYKGWAHGLKAAGYATNPQYAKLLIDIIEEYELYKFDNGEAVKVSKKSLKEAKRIEKLEKRAAAAQKRAAKAEKKAQKAQMRAAKAQEKLLLKSGGAEVAAGAGVGAAAAAGAPANVAGAGNASMGAGVAANSSESNVSAKDAPSGSKVTYKGKTHTVKAGDTLYSIARNNGITVDDILRLNRGIKADSLAIGTVLKLE